MNANILDEVQPNIMERLGEIYNCKAEYKKNIEKKMKLFS